MRKRLIGIATLAALALASTAAATAAILPVSGITPSSGGAIIIQKGKCSGTSTSLLKVTTNTKTIQVAFQVTEHQLTLSPTPVNRQWSAALVRNGSPLFSGVVGTGPSGSFTVTRSFAASPSTTPTTIVGAAKRLDGHESCFATITF
jgi:hypothetical protein